MKKLLYACLGLLFALGGCSKDETEAQPALDVTSSSELVKMAIDGKSGTVSFTSAGGSAELEVKTNQSDWSVAVEGGAWCKAVKSNGKLTVSADPNLSTAEQSATVTLNAGTGADKAVVRLKVTQPGDKQATLNVMSESEYVQMAEDGRTGTVGLPVTGGSADLQVQSNQIDWAFEVEKDAQWCKVVRDGAKLTISAEKNPRTEGQAATVTLSAGPEANRTTVVLTVKQPGQEPATVSVEPKDLELSAEGESKDVTLTTNQTIWDATSPATWLKIEKGEGKITLTAQKNATGGEQTAKVTVKVGEGQNTAETTIDVKQPAFDARMIIELTLTAAGAAKLPLAGIVDCTVDWGDNSVPEKLDGTKYPSHTYAAAGTYNVAVSGTVTQLNANNGTLYPVAQRKLLTAVKQWGNTMLTSMENAFYQCSNLKSVAEPGDAFANVGSFKQAFASCTSLAELPATLFADCPGVTSFQSVFQSCTALTALPETLFADNPGEGTFQSAFQGCTALREIPASLFANSPNFSSFQSAFSGCTALEAIPAGLFDGIGAETKVTFSSVFQGCTGIKAIPSGLFDKCLAATTFSSAFDGCKLIAQIPSGLFRNNPAATYFASVFAQTAITEIPSGLFDAITGSNVNFSGCFKNCTQLAAIPSGLFDKCVGEPSFSSVFEGCAGLTAIPAALFDKCIDAKLFSNCFSGCTGITSIPSNLFGNVTKGYNFSMAFAQTAITMIPDGLFAASKATIGQFAGVFKGCKNLTQIPADLLENLTAITTLANLFEGCTGITQIPAGLFDDNTLVTTFSAAFKGCTSIKTIPAGLFDKTVKVTDFSSLFEGCADIEAIPADLFADNPSVTTFLSTFNGCIGLTAIPAGLFDNNLKASTFRNCFSGCTNLSGESPYTEITVGGAPVKVHLYERNNYTGTFTKITNSYRGFYGCTGLSDYGSMTGDWK